MHALMHVVVSYAAFGSVGPNALGFLCLLCVSHQHVASIQTYVADSQWCCGLYAAHNQPQACNVVANMVHCNVHLPSREQEPGLATVSCGSATQRNQCCPSQATFLQPCTCHHTWPGNTRREQVSSSSMSTVACTPGKALGCAQFTRGNATCVELPVQHT